MPKPLRHYARKFKIYCMWLPFFAAAYVVLRTICAFDGSKRNV